MLYEDLSGAIIGASFSVLNQLKPGLDEKLYERALALELKAHGLRTEQQRRFPVYYRGTEIGTLIPDLIVESSIIVDTKVVSVFNENHLAQMLGYLAITNLKLAMLINFKHSKLEWKRVVHNQ